MTLGEWQAVVAWRWPPRVPRKSALRLPCSVNPPGCGVVDCICGTLTLKPAERQRTEEAAEPATSVARGNGTARFHPAE